MKSNLIAALLLALSPAALAQDETGPAADPTDILGAWTFATKPYRDEQCVMTGNMTLSPDPEPGVYQCELTAIEICSMWGRSVVVQNCSVRRFGNQVSVRSEIREMLEAKSAAEGFVYVPDNFALTVQSENRMYGTLVSAATAPAEFIRDLNGIS